MTHHSNSAHSAAGSRSVPDQPLNPHSANSWLSGTMAAIATLCLLGACSSTPAADESGGSTHDSGNGGGPASGGLPGIGDPPAPGMNAAGGGGSGGAGTPSTITVSGSTIEVPAGESFLREAQSMVRARVAAMTEDLVVILHGRNELEAPLVLTEEDSGQNGFRVIWRGADEGATLSGARRISGWVDRGEVWAAPINGARFRQLYVNDERAVRARAPNLEDEASMGPYHRLVRWDLAPENEYGDIPVRAIVVNSDDVPPGVDGGEAELFVKRHWVMGHMRVERVEAGDGESRVLFREADSGQQARANPGKVDGQTFHWENARELLDAPGEWFLDVNADEVLYVPRPGQDLASLDVYAPELETLLDVASAHDVAIERLTLEHSTWMTPEEKGYGELQAAFFTIAGDYLPGAIRIAGSERVTVERCTIQHTGAHGILLTDDTSHVDIVGNHITDTSASGVSLSNPWNQQSGGSVDDRIAHNTIHHIGRVYSGAIGIGAMYPAGLVIENNRIYDLPYSGVSIGYNWHEEDTTTARDNQVRFNDIYDITMLHDDGAGVYTLGVMHGSAVHDNWVHDIVPAEWAEQFPRVAFYFDQGSTGISVFHNSVTNIGYGIHENHDPSTPLEIYDNAFDEGSLQSVRDAAGPAPEYEWPL